MSSGTAAAPFTPQQLRDGLAEILPTLLAIGPKEIGEEPPGWRADDMWSHDLVQVVEYEPIDGREEGALVVGAEGVSWIAPDERCRTVRWDEIVGASRGTTGAAPYSGRPANGSRSCRGRGAAVTL